MFGIKISFCGSLLPFKWLLITDVAYYFQDSHQYNSITVSSLSLENGKLKSTLPNLTYRWNSFHLIPFRMSALKIKISPTHGICLYFWLRPYMIIYQELLEICWNLSDFQGVDLIEPVPICKLYSNNSDQTYFWSNGYLQFPRYNLYW